MESSDAVISTAVPKVATVAKKDNSSPSGPGSRSSGVSISPAAACAAGSCSYGGEQQLVALA